MPGDVIASEIGGNFATRGTFLGVRPIPMVEIVSLLLYVVQSFLRTLYATRFSLSYDKQAGVLLYVLFMFLSLPATDKISLTKR